MFCGSQPSRIPLFWEMAAQFTFKCRCRLYCNHVRLWLCFHVYRLWFWHLLNKRSYKNRLVGVTKLLQGSSCGLYTVLVIQGKFVTGLYTDPHSHKAAGGYCGTPFQEQIQEPVFISHFQFFVFPPFLALLLTQCVPSFLTFLFPSMPSSSRPFSVPCLRLEQVQRVSGWWRELHLWQQILTWELVYCSRFL